MIRKSGSLINSTGILCPLDNVGPTGSVEVLSGELQLWEDGSHSGVFEAQANAVLRFHEGIHTLNDGTRFNGEGWIEARGEGELRVATQALVVNQGKFELGGGFKLKGPGVGVAGSFHSSNLFKWSGGDMENVTFSNGALMEIEEALLTDVKVFESSRLRNYGTVKWNAGDISMKSTNGNSYIDNYGLWEANSDNKILDGGGLFDKAFFNTFDPNNPFNKGVFSKTGGAGGETEFLVRLHNDTKIKKNGRMIKWDPAKYSGNGTVEE